MEVPRYVIEDLLPLYLAGEVSEETGGWIEDYLSTHKELQTMVEAAKETNWRAKVELPMQKEAELRAYERVQELALRRTIVIVGAALASMICLIVSVALVAALFFVGR